MVEITQHYQNVQPILAELLCLGGDGRYLYDHNINSVISTLVIGDYFDPTLVFCDLALNAWNSESTIRDAWHTVNFNDGGWTKPTSQMMSVSLFGFVIWTLFIFI